MPATLLERALDAAGGHTGPDGIAPTPFPGVAIFRQAAPGALQYAVARPLVAMVLQGAKRVMVGSRSYDYRAGETLLIGADLPNASQVVEAAPGAPYVSLVVELDPVLVEALVAQMDEAGTPATPCVSVMPSDAEVADAAARLLALLGRPAAIPVLGEQLRRELHYWLLSGRHGAAIRTLGLPDSHGRRIARALALIRDHLDRPLRIEALAAAAGMSASSFHGHFRALTSLSPIQYQKQLRLIEARRLMLADGAGVSRAAHAVGYESVSQFTREYGRMFGAPPAREVRSARARLDAAA